MNVKYSKNKSNFSFSSLDFLSNLLGINVIEIDPAWTSQNCSRCQRHLEHADVNAAFNIAASANALFNPVKNDKFSRKGTLISRKSSSKIDKTIFETLDPQPFKQGFALRQ